MNTEQIDNMDLNYPIELIRDTEEGGFLATHPDLPGCAAQGETAEEAIANLDDARKLWIESRVEQNLPVPLPLSEEPSGKILLRMARSLHAELAKHAARQGVSLNLLINSVLAEYVGGAEYRAELSAFRRSVEAINAAISSLKMCFLQQQASQSRARLVTDATGITLMQSLVSTYSDWIWAVQPQARGLLKFHSCYLTGLPPLSEESENERDI